MRTFTFDDSAAFNPGLWFEDVGDIRSLGIVLGSGATSWTILTGHRLPPIMDTALCALEAFPAEKTNNATLEQYHVLEAPRYKRSDILVHVKTRGMKRWRTTSPRTPGQWRAMAGNPQVIATGTCENAHHRGLVEWVDAIVVLRPHDAILVTQVNDAPGKEHVIIHDDQGPRALTYQEYLTELDHARTATAFPLWAADRR